MKQPLMLLPPAQAEALYDAILQQPSSPARSSKPKKTPRDEPWDDGQASVSAAFAELSPSRRPESSRKAR